VRLWVAAATVLLAGCPNLVQCVSDLDCYRNQFCDPTGICENGTPTTGGSSTASAGSSTAGSGSGGHTAGTSGGTGTTSGTTSGNTGGSTSGGCPQTLQAQTRVLATVDSFNGQVWDLTTPPGSELIGPANLSDIPAAVGVTAAGEILVQLDDDGLVAFDETGTYEGQIQVPAPSGDGPGGNGLALLPQPAGPTLVVVCGYAATGFYYDGGGSFSANGTAYTNALWTAEDNLNGCFPGPCNTIYAAYDDQLLWLDALTGNPQGGGDGLGTVATSQGQVEGGARDANGDLLIAGDDGSNDGFVALFSSSGVCKEARSGGPCTLTCNGGCVAGDATLASTPLHQAAAMPDGTFLVTVGTANQLEMNNVYRVDPSNGLAVSTYLTGPSGTDFYGLVVSPQPL